MLLSCWDPSVPERKTGFEPATSCLEGRSSGQLSYFRVAARREAGVRLGDRARTCGLRVPNAALSLLSYT